MVLSGVFFSQISVIFFTKHKFYNKKKLFYDAFDFEEEV
jgi:hypothetical protein